MAVMQKLKKMVVPHNSCSALCETLRCMLCASTLRKQHFVLPICQHAFCQQCMREHAKRTQDELACPVCLTCIGELNDLPVSFPKSIRRKVLSCRDDNVVLSVYAKHVQNNVKLRCQTRHCKSAAMHVCQQCCAAICDRCASTGSHVQHEQESINAILNTHRFSLEDAKKATQSGIDEQRALVARLDACWHQQELELRRAIKDVNAHMAALHRQLLTRTDQLCKDLQQKHQQVAALYKQQKSAAEMAIHQLDQLDALITALAEPDQWLTLLLNCCDVTDRVGHLAETKAGEAAISILCQTYEMKAEQSLLMGTIQEKQLDKPPTPKESPRRREMKRSVQQPRFDSCILNWTATSSGDGQPRGVAFNSAGCLLVADEQRMCVYKCPSIGSLIAHHGVIKGALENSMPRDIAIAADGTMAITSGDACGLYFPDGTLVTQLGDCASFHSACGVAVTPDNNIAVVDELKPALSLFSPDGTRLLHLCGNRKSNSPLTEPKFIAVDENRRFIVSDADCVKLFSAQGEYLGRFAENKEPKGVCAVPGGDILVAECVGHSVSLYDSAGGYIRTVISQQETEDFSWPNGLALSSDGMQMAVTQMASNKILVFDVSDND